MYLLIFLISVLVALVLHEGAHAVVMRRKGIEIEEIGLGFSVKFLPSYTFKPKHFPRIKVSPLLAGAYVKPADVQKMEELPFEDKVEIFGAGAFVNFLSFGVIMPLGLLFEANGWEARQRYLLALESVLLALALLHFRHSFYRWVSQAIGLSGLVVLFVPVWRGVLFSFFRDIDPTGGMNFGKSLILFAGLSLNLAFFNLLPLPLLDGGKLFDERISIFKYGRVVVSCLSVLIIVVGLTILFILATIGIYDWLSALF